MEILVLKTGALGDVLRTTSILPGLHARYPEARITWLTARGALDLVRLHPLINTVEGCDPKNTAEIEALGERLATTRWERVLSFDDEEPLCRLASRLGGMPELGVLSGAYLAQDGSRRYTEDVSPWFDMGLLSVHGKEEADRRKVANRESHPAIYARMLEIEMGEPELPLRAEDMRFAQRFAERTGLFEHRPIIGMNTGAGGRWESKRLSVERTVALMQELHRRLAGDVGFLLLGGPEEDARNARIVELAQGVHLVDGGTHNSLLETAALVSVADLLISSDSLALHLAVSQRVPVVSFFAPTSAAEIELYGRGEKVQSTAPDYCSYRPDADTLTLTVERLADAALRVLEAARSTDG